MLFIFYSLIVLVLLYSRNLILVLLILELLGFFLVFFVSFFSTRIISIDFLVLVVFSVLVIEGVIGLSGLISLVTFSGADYLTSRSLLKC